MTSPNSTIKQIITETLIDCDHTRLFENEIYVSSTSTNDAMCLFQLLSLEVAIKVIIKLFISINYFVYCQVALKRQQAVEDAIALRLASTETGKAMDSLPPGKIFGMTVTEAKPELAGSMHVDNKAPDDMHRKLDSVSSTSKSPLVSQNAIEMLSSLFPHRKRSVLELVLRRCDLDLLR